LIVNDLTKNPGRISANNLNHRNADLITVKALKYAAARIIFIIIAIPQRKSCRLNDSFLRKLLALRLPLANMKVSL
jgi:hypothetical protein